MATLDQIVARARVELGDIAKPFSSSVVADGSTTSVELNNSPVSSDITVTVDGAPASNWTLNPREGVLAFDSPPPANSTITVAGSTFWYFLEEDWTMFAEEAIVFHLHNRETNLFGMASIETPLVAWLTVIEAVWTLIGSSATDLDIYSPEGVSIPRSQRTRYLTEYAERLRARYLEHAAQLNVGLNRVEVLNVRRRARSTGKLVPINRSQEFEDPTPRERIYPQIPSGLVR